MVYDFMYQRMILFVLYGLFHKFHANVAFPAIYAHVLPNRKYRKYCVITYQNLKYRVISCEPKKKISLMGDRDPTENEAAERDGRPTRLTLRSHHYHIGFDRYYNGHIHALQCIHLKLLLTGI